MDIARDRMYARDVIFSPPSPTGPGRYDPVYEEGNVDYPDRLRALDREPQPGRVLRLLAEGKVEVSSLAPTRVPLAEARRLRPAASPRPAADRAAHLRRRGREGLNAMGRALETADLYSLKWLDTPRLSPHGAAIAYTEGGLDRDRDSMVSRVCLVPVGGGSVTCLTPAGAFDDQPCWSPDGRRLAFVSNRSGEQRLWLAEYSSGGERGAVWCLDEAPAGATNPAWSPDGGRNSFVAPGQGAGQARKHLWTIPVAGGGATPLGGGDGDAASPAWSPDGQCIAMPRG